MASLDRQEKITPSSIVWFLLSLTTMIIVGMVGAWGHSVQARQDNFDARLTTDEQSIVQLKSDTQAIQESQREMVKKLDLLLERGK